MDLGNPVDVHSLDIGTSIFVRSMGGTIYRGVLTAKGGVAVKGFHPGETVIGRFIAYPSMNEFGLRSTDSVYIRIES